jgi:hypothetical protein
MSPIQAFRSRIKAVRKYVKSLHDIGEGMNSSHNFYNKAATIASSRAAVYIMIYNCVEHAITMSYRNLVSDINSNRVHFGRLTYYWQKEFLRITQLEKIREGTNHAQFTYRIVEITQSEVYWNSTDNGFFSGNIDHKTLINVAKNLGERWKPPKGTLGGSDLHSVKTYRNDLAHGEEEFINIGSIETTESLLLKLDRVRDVIISFLEMMERHRVRQKYLRA